MKSLFISIRLIFFMIAVLCFTCCKKISVGGRNILLYDQPLSVIKQYIAGDWKLIYGKGGIATTIQYYDDVYWKINNDSIKILNDGSIYANSVMHWSYDLGTYTNGDSTFLLKFYNTFDVPSVYVIERIYNDTLLLHDNSSDAYFYHFVRNK